MKTRGVNESCLLCCPPILDRPIIIILHTYIHINVCIKRQYNITDTVTGRGAKILHFKPVRDGRFPDGRLAETVQGRVPKTTVTPRTK